jgi:hypothetical protein
LKLLADGSIPAKEVFKATHDNGFSDRTVNRAKKSLNIRTVKVGQPGSKAGGWYWSLPNIQASEQQTTETHIRETVSQFSDAFARYSETASENVTPSQPAPVLGCDGVTFSKGENGEERRI